MQNAKIKLHNKGKIEFLGYRQYSTFVKKSNIAITPIKVDKTINKFAVMDLETMNVKGVQTPVAISCCNGLMKKNNKIFIIDHILLQSDPVLAVNKLWRAYFEYIIKNEHELIFAHNLGNFDGYYLYKALLNIYDPIIVQCLIDDNKTFISISLNINNNKIVWKDSIRIFPVSLDKLCQIFNVEGKLISYNMKFNDLSLFNNTKLWGLFKKYALQDSIALFKALYTAQVLYHNDYKVDITSIYSSPTLSLKIFRIKFLNLSIPILTKDVDEFVRDAYYGGGTDYYKAYVENIKYYDVNSLYPNAMKNPMPLNLIKIHKDMSNIELKNFFGYVEVEVTCPTNMLKPVLPFKYEGKTIYPVGNWRATYFSEELKTVEMLGYQFKLIKGYEFSKANIFDC